MEDVARRAGVSLSTVSRVISQKIPVSEGTAQEVQRAIKDLGYRPNLIASGLRSKSGRSVGLIVPTIRGDPFFAALIDSVDRSVISRGFNLLLVNAHSDPAFEEQMIDNLIRRHVDGIIFSMVSDESGVRELSTDGTVPVVMLDRVREGGRMLSVVVDNRAAGRLAASHLADLGHRNLGCVTGPRQIHLSIDRLEGYRGELLRRGLTLPESNVIGGDFTFESGVAAARKIAAMVPRPTAVWAHNDLMACGLVRGLTRSGIAVPDAVSVVGMDDLELASMLDPSLTTVSQPIGEMAERAVSLILDRTHAEPWETRIVLAPSLVVRESTVRLERG